MPEITINMKLEEWNQVLSILAEAPFRISQPLIAKIQQQAQGQLPQQGPQAGNGADHLDGSPLAN